MIELRKKKNFMAEVSTSSFSDIMFFLMLFFLITSTMITPGIIKLTLPRAENVQSINKPPIEIAISITKDLKYYLNNNPVAFSEIEPALQKLKISNNEIYAIVRCENSIAVQSLVDVLQIGSKTHVKMVLATKR